MAPLDHVDRIELQATEVSGDLHDSPGVRASPGPGQPLASEGQPAGGAGRNHSDGAHTKGNPMQGREPYGPNTVSWMASAVASWRPSSHRSDGDDSSAPCPDCGIRRDAAARRIQGAKGSQIRSTSAFDRPVATSSQILGSRSRASSGPMAGPSAMANAPRFTSQKAPCGRKLAALLWYWMIVALRPSSHQNPASEKGTATAAAAVPASRTGRARRRATAIVSGTMARGTRP